MGVITASRLKAGEKFGPVPPTLTLAEPTMLIGHRTCDTLPDVHTVKLDVHCFATGDQLAEWVPYVLSARCAAEQNMEATLFDDGLLYFCVTRNVDDGAQLLIWYSDHLAQLLGVPEIDEDCRMGDVFRCPKCKDEFQYPNCLRAHLRFRCRYRRHHPKPSDVIGSRQPSPQAITDPPRSAADDARVEKMAASGDAHHVIKRKPDDDDADDSTAAKRRPSPANILSRAGVALNGSVPSRSAFQRVDKTPTGPTTPPSPSTAISSSSPSDVAHMVSPLPLSVATSAAVLDSRFPVTGTSGMFMFPADRLHSPMMLNAEFVAPANSFPGSFYPKIGGSDSEYVRGVVTNNNVMSGNDVKLLKQSSLGVAIDHSRLPSAAAPLSLVAHNGYRTSNPMVERLLQLVSAPRQAAHSTTNGKGGTGGGGLPASLPSLQLAQNWCAKCNTSFRMTSDLVYHMRTHHKRDLDPATQGRRKDDNKLRCDVCGESFKERHHLTRHMTSHT